MPEPTTDTYSKAECDLKHQALTDSLDLKQQHTNETLSRIEAGLANQASDMKILANQLIKIRVLLAGGGDEGEATDEWGDQIPPKRRRRPAHPAPLSWEWVQRYWVVIMIVGSLLGINVTGMVRNASTDEVNEIAQEAAAKALEDALSKLLVEREKGAAPTSDRRGHERTRDRKIE